MLRGMHNSNKIVEDLNLLSHEKCSLPGIDLLGGEVAFKHPHVLVPHSFHALSVGSVNLISTLLQKIILLWLPVGKLHYKGRCQYRNIFPATNRVFFKLRFLEEDF